ncbi:Hypothetical predicted protein [Lecanosticta acicola]|uniref:Uncharacterized protein n=1 Tax=Lecanosticta acicola TaxID=111012 RepID=A0AAI9E8J5_9PEZI|nr:Hypothetical predicted protein [Lecanosticta acicola]
MSNNSDANAASPADALSKANDMSRPVLGEKSPNVRRAVQSHVPMDKSLFGSPLKRNFTAAMEGDDGFLYLKKRKHSWESPLSQVSTPTEENGSRTSNADRSVIQPMPVQETAVPKIQHAAPTEPNTPASSLKEEDQDASSAERRSFSSLINYDPSSQTAPTTDQNSGPVVHEPSHAELLKLRLRVAMYKVQTNQINVPFSELEDPKSSPVQATQTKEPDTTIDLVQDWKRRMVQQAPALMPSLLSAPILRPTPYISRLAYGKNIPSSPPAGLPEKLPQGLPPTTPRSPRINRSDEQELTSSIVKGRVAEGLLGLRNAR